MEFPRATYRIQLSSQFSFEKLTEIVAYLETLGVTTIYASPFFQSRKNSTHGYDIVDAFNLNKEIGTLKNFSELCGILQQKKMNWLQDIVPNHMAFDSANLWLRNIFELGPKSKYYSYFDIDWDYNEDGQVMAAFLGDSLEEVINNREIRLNFNQQGFSINYYDHSYPASARSYPLILNGFENEWKEKFQNTEICEGEWEDLRSNFYREIADDDFLKAKIGKYLNKLNAFEQKIKEILKLQYFIPTHWKQTEKEINYRRFFTINDLICLRMEDAKVFETYHYFTKELFEAGLVDSFRIDHIDGLFNPKEYLNRLRELMGNDCFIIVEKILERDEELPQDWKIEGTSGYEFLADVNQLFIKSESEKIFKSEYEKINPRARDYEKLVFEKKLFNFKERMGGELQNLWNLLKGSGILNKEQISEDEKWKDAIAAFLSGFPVYRIYPESFPLNEKEKNIIEAACNKALLFFPNQKNELEDLKNIFLGSKGNKEKGLYFLQRCQQFSGPLAAKGVEDTVFYSYNRLISQNEVGDSPAHFGISTAYFHERMLNRNRFFPHSLNATATHDTKRGEDARMRISVLSEIPEEWFEKVREWNEFTANDRQNSIPEENERYFLYQVLIGGLPFEGFNEEDFLSRTKEYLQKALREAKVNSNWSEPNEDYETAVFDYVERIFQNEKFKESFLKFHERISYFGAVKSLGQTLLKITAPGIPDVYQGTELWDFSFVDPDNRRPVNYSIRNQYLSDFKEFKSINLNKKINSIKADFKNGRIKMYVLFRALQFRKKHTGLFEGGEYLPVSISGNFASDFIGFARKNKNEWAFIIIPIRVVHNFENQEMKLKKDEFTDTIVSLPENAPSKLKNVFSGEVFSSDGKISIAEVLSDFPVALLQNRTA